MPVKAHGNIVAAAPLVVDGVKVGVITSSGKSYFSTDIIIGNTFYDPDTKQFIDFISLLKGAEGKSPNAPWTPNMRAAYILLLKMEYKGLSVAALKREIDGWTTLTYAEELQEAGVPNYNVLAFKAGVPAGFLKALVEHSPEEMRKELGDIAIAQALVNSEKNLLVALVDLVKAGGQDLDPELLAKLQAQMAAWSVPIRKKIFKLTPEEQALMAQRQADLLGIDPSQVNVPKQQIVKQGAAGKVSIPLLVGGAVVLWLILRKG
jgi:hypothetical protein